jgi:putative DNA primase/helicase
MTPAYERHGAGRVLSADETADRRKQVRGFWHHCDYATGTPAARYLARRGLPWLVGHDHVRYRPDAPHPGGGRLPAMVWLVHDPAGSIAAVHRTYLAPDGTKAAVEPLKATFGSFAGGAICLHPAAPEMVVGEGLETTASAALLLGLPGWAAVSCGNLGANLALPAGVRRVTIAADPDVPGQRAAAQAAARWRAESRTVLIATPDTPGQDFNDVLQDRAERAAEAAHG